MWQKICGYFINNLRIFFTATFNIFIFLPYFFSIKTLIKTLFYPWKNMYYPKRVTSFSLWLEKIFFNLVSRSIGFFMRFSLIVFYLLLQIVFLLTFPFLFSIFFVLNFVFSFFFLFKKTPSQIKEEELRNFIRLHLIEEKNKEKVIAWFNEYYKEKEKKSNWWLKENLFLYPPLARDWAYGYTYLLSNYSDELTSEEYLRKKPSIIDRDQEIREIEEVLSKSDLNNILIVGEEGVGKHTIVDSLAYRIYHGIANQRLIYRRILKLKMEKILEEYQDPIKRESFFEQLLQEAAEAKNVIIFIDNIDRYLHQSENQVDLSYAIKKFGETENLQIIGITTPYLYQKFIFPNKKISQIFSKIDVYEISKEAAYKILQKKALNLEKKYNVFISIEAIIETIEKSSFYLTDIPFPEKAIDLLDLSCIKTKEEGGKIVTPNVVDHALSQKAHIPVVLTEKMKEKLINLESYLKSEIIAQDQVISRLSTIIKNSFLLREKRNKPLASFLFLGPTGVGKTHTAKALCRYLFGSDKYLIRFDMAEYQLKQDVVKLIGSYETQEPGLLSTAIRENPYGVLILDELEKSTHDLLNIFLTILDEGYFFDSTGHRVDCKNLIIIATSNAGSYYFYQSTNPLDTHTLIDILIKKNFFNAEFLNRFDAILLFNPLSLKDLIIISEKIFNQLKNDLFSLYKINILVDQNYFKKIINDNVDIRFGARDLARVIKENIEKKVIDLILKNKIKEKETILIT